MADSTGDSQGRKGTDNPTKAKDSPRTSKNSDSKYTVESVQLAAAEFLRGKPKWVLGMAAAVRRFLYVAIPVCIWCVALIFEEALPQSLVFGLTNLIAVILFLLALPISALQRADLVLEKVYSFSGNSAIVGLLMLLGIMLVNFLIIGAIKGFLDMIRGR